MPDISNSAYSEVDNNCNSAPPNGAPAGFAPNQTEAIFRQIMGAIKRFWDRINGVITTSGSAGAYVYTPSNTSYPNTYAQGETFRAIANFTSVGTDTMNINGLGALKLYKPSSSGPVGLAAGDIQSAQMFAFSYDSALNSGGGGFHVQSGLSPASGGVTSIADATNGGLNFSGSTGAVTAKLQPSDLATKSSPTTSDSVVIMDAAASNVAKTSTLAQIQAAVGFDLGYVLLNNSQAAGSSGYVLSSGAWNQLSLTNKATDTQSNVVSLTSNKFTLVAGTYRIRVWYTGSQGIGAHQLRLRNATGSTTLLDGNSSLANSSSVSCFGTLVGQFTVAASQALEIDAFAGSAGGAATSSGSADAAIYHQIELQRVA